jgi:signal transduction histidine kinase
MKLVIKDNGTFKEKTEISLNGNGINNMKTRAEKIEGKLQIYYNEGYTIELLFDYVYY